MFYADPDLFYGSTHQYPHYPGTGAREERGVAGNIVNEPMPPGSGSAEFRAAMSDSMLPALKAFKPEFVFISAGFDAHAADPLADIRLTEDDFGWVTRELMAVADRHCSGRLVSTLEGRVRSRRARQQRRRACRDIDGGLGLGETTGGGDLSNHGG